MFEKFADYVPRQEPSSWLAGGKQMLLDRIEWVVMPDPATASAALQNGEVDWWETPIADLVPVLKKNRNIDGRYRRPAGQHRQLPHEPPASALQRRAGAPRGPDGDEPGRLHARRRRRRHRLWKPLPGFFTPGTPLYTEEGGEILKGKRDLDAAKKLLDRERLCRPAGHLPGGAGPADHQGAGRCHRRPAEATRHERRFRRHRLGQRSARAARRKRRPARAAGRCSTPGMPAPTASIPPSYTAIRANGDKAWFGWPTSAEVEAEIAAWYEAANLDEEKAAISRLNKAACEDVVYAPTGFFLSYQAWRKNVSGIVKGPLPFFWGVSARPRERHESC